MYIYGGIVLVAAAAIVARRDCVRSAPLFIVHGLMWYDSVVLGFFLARLSGGSAARFLFVVGGEVRRLSGQGSRPSVNWLLVRSPRLTRFFCP